MEILKRRCLFLPLVSLLFMAPFLASGQGLKGQEGKPSPSPIAMPSLLLSPADSVSRLAFGSCFKVSRDGHQIWQSIARHEPDLFVYAGDTLYPDAENEKAGLPDLRAGYAQLASLPVFAQFRAHVPVVAVWDDHDYGANDGGADFGQRAMSQELFAEAWDLSVDDPRRTRPGVYSSLLLGDAGKRLQVVVLDTRFFRSPLKASPEQGAPGRERYVPDASAGNTMLGDAQWKWLETQLAEPADLRLIVSTVQVLADGHGWEGWRLFPAERERLFELLRRHDTATTLLLSGDRHVAGFYERDIGLKQPLLEFTASPLNNTIPFPYRYGALGEAGPSRLGPLYGNANFGVLEFDWARRNVRLALRDREGDLLRVVQRDF